MLEASARPSTALPPMNFHDDKAKREEADNQTRPSIVSPQSGISPVSKYPGPPPPYSTYISTPAPQESHLRTDTKAQMESPLPSLRSVTGIGEALDTSRSTPRFSQAYNAAPPSSSYGPSSQYPYNRAEPQAAPPPQSTQASHPGPLAQSPYPSGSAPQRRESQHWQPQPPPPPPPNPQSEQRYTYGPPEPHGSYGQAPPPPHSSVHHQQQQQQQQQPHASYAPARYEPQSRRDDTHYRAELPVRTEDSPLKAEHTNGRTYGDSVKRHLDHFDLESALNDISESARSLWDFSNHYRQRAHDTQRSGPLPGSTPNLGEIEEMASHTGRAQDSLARLRDVILSQQAALAERPTRDAHKASISTATEESLSSGGTSSKDGFAGPDLKKRRGRAAPPGRCHSCNRAETPEWRRGPDGARTLCNACGLHYAKLTRKMGANNKTNVGSSTLKPKSVNGSPPR